MRGGGRGALATLALLLFLLWVGCAGNGAGVVDGVGVSLVDSLSAALALLWTVRYPVESAEEAVIVGSSDSVE